jgi:hypothetical protein
LYMISLRSYMGGFLASDALQPSTKPGDPVVRQAKGRKLPNLQIYDRIVEPGSKVTMLS